MRKIIVLILLVLVHVGRTSADNLEVGNIVLTPGGTAQIAISLQNPTLDYMAYQFDMVLPEGVDIAKNEQGQPIVSLNEERITDHASGVSLMGDRRYRLIAYSLNDDGFIGKEGVLVYVTLQADATAAIGTKTLTLTSQVMNDVGGNEIKWDGTSASIYVVSSELLEEMKEKRDSCVRLQERIEKVYAELTEDKLIEPHQKMYMDESFDLMKDDIERLLKVLDEEHLLQSEFSDEVVADVRKLFTQTTTSVSWGNIYGSPLFTYPSYVLKGTFSCNEGGRIYVGSIDVKNEEKLIYTFYSKAFINDYSSGKESVTSIGVVPDKGYRIKKIVLHYDNSETEVTSWDSDDYGAYGLTVEFGKQPIPGDANGDAKVTDADVDAVRQRIMGMTPVDFDRDAADANNDSKINIADIVKIISIKQE